MNRPQAKGIKSLLRTNYSKKLSLKRLLVFVYTALLMYACLSSHKTLLWQRYGLTPGTHGFFPFSPQSNSHTHSPCRFWKLASQTPLLPHGTILRPQILAERNTVSAFGSAWQKEEKSIKQALMLACTFSGQDGNLKLLQHQKGSRGCKLWRCKKADLNVQWFVR